MRGHFLGMTQAEAQAREWERFATIEKGEEDGLTMAEIWYSRHDTATGCSREEEEEAQGLAGTAQRGGL